ncbi:DUF1361 domain-containing protein [Puia sp. P3]|uniref:DUF1361 domain-containing protein n=1 Tax=Puia sp. P3 TaxID=3423952 RepID=UPI003D67CF15
MSTTAAATSRVPEWFDLSLILSFAFNGLLLGVLSVRQMERLFLPNPTTIGSWLFLYPIMVLNALGVYTGRYLRYNSWDIISDPLAAAAGHDKHGGPSPPESTCLEHGTLFFDPADADLPPAAKRE